MNSAAKAIPAPRVASSHSIGSTNQPSPAPTASSARPDISQIRRLPAAPAGDSDSGGGLTRSQGAQGIGGAPELFKLLWVQPGWNYAIEQT